MTVCVLLASGYFAYHLLAVLFVALAARFGRAAASGTGTGKGLERR